VIASESHFKADAALRDGAGLALEHVAKRSQIKTLLEYKLYRGLYSRVDRQLGVDPSYVSRVAHGKRHSPKIERKLKAEIARIEKLRPK